MYKIWAILPVKSLAQTKSRLTAVLTSTERAELTQLLVRRTLAILQDVPTIHEVVVVSRDQQIAQIAKQAHVFCIPEALGNGLNQAVQKGYAFVSQQDAAFALIIPSDLAFLTPADITAVCQQASQGEAIIAPDQLEDGTNALLLPTGLDFWFQYGRFSSQKHISEAQRHGLHPQIIRRPNLQFDLDTVQDFTLYQNQQTTTNHQFKQNLTHPCQS